MRTFHYAADVISSFWVVSPSSKARRGVRPRVRYPWCGRRVLYSSSQASRSPCRSARLVYHFCRNFTLKNSSLTVRSKRSQKPFVYGAWTLVFRWAICWRPRWGQRLTTVNVYALKGKSYPTLVWWVPHLGNPSNEAAEQNKRAPHPQA